MTAPAPARPRPWHPALDRGTAYRLAATEYQRMLAVLRDLGPGDWDRPTECPGWDVRTMAAHLLGTAEMPPRCPKSPTRTGWPGRRAEGSTR